MGGFPPDLSQVYTKVALQAKSQQFSFIGPSYESRARKSDAEKCINLYVEVDEGHGASPMVLLGTPGLKKFCTLTDTPLRGLWGFDTGLYAAAGGTLFRIFPDGSLATIGTFPPALGPVQFFPNGNQLFFTSGGNGYISDNAGISQVIPAITAAFLDGYFIAQQPGKNIQISGIYEGRSWDPADYAVKEGYPDPIVAILADHEQLWLFGSQKTEVWYDSGAANFPFQRIPGAYIEQGCIAQSSPASLDNSVFWLGGDSRGAGIVWRAMGYAPARVSNHAVEEQIRKYSLTSTIRDAIGYAYQEGGHSFYRLDFPSADHSWCYDVATGMWHERGSWDLVHGTYHAQLARYHAFTMGQHFVGGGGQVFDVTRNTNVYAQSLDYFDEDGAVIRRLRSSPHVNTALRRNTYHSLTVDMEVGDVSALLDGVGNPRPVQVMLRFSKDGGETWSEVMTANAGMTGQTTARVQFRRLGVSKDAAFEVTISDSIQVCIIDAYLHMTAGTD